MPNPNKDKGTDWERRIVRALCVLGIGAFRPHNEGWQDSGDIHGLSPFVGQAKSWRSWEDAIREGLDGAERQKVQTGEPFGMVFVKRPRRTVGEGYAVMTVETFARVLVRLRRAEELLARDAPGAYRYHVGEGVRDRARPFPRGDAPA